MVKRRLYRTMRTLLTKDWPRYLKPTVDAINNTPNSAIGYLKPSEITSHLEDPKIDAKIGIPKDVEVNEQKNNQIAYEKNKDALQVGDYVYLDFPPTTMEKGFDTPVSILHSLLIGFVGILTFSPFYLRQPFTHAPPTRKL